jgi:hypothetical protein
MISKNSSDLMSAAISSEICFLDTILLSPLHRQSKSPTLWYHRWWLVSNTPIFFKSAPNVTNEFDAVLKAGERHKHNYYAWQYSRRLYNLIKKIAEPAELKTLHVHVLRLVLAWCKQHPSDTSGWSFLSFLMQQSGLEKNGSDEASYINTIEEVLAYVETVGWQKEALWHYLRTDVGCNKNLDSTNRPKLVEKLRTIVHILDSAPSPTKTLDNTAQLKLKSVPQEALDWIHEFGIASEL